jgi:hypothetical protein
MKNFLIGRRRKALEVKALELMRKMVLPIVASLQKPGHSIPLDVLLDPLVLGYIRSYSLLAVHLAIKDQASAEEGKEIWAAIIEQFLIETAGSKTAGREMGCALVNYADSHNADLRRGHDLAIRQFAVATGDEEFNNDPIVVQAFDFATASIKARASVFGVDDDTPQKGAARFLHAQVLHHVSSKYGVENPNWREWLRGW